MGKMGKQYGQRGKSPNNTWNVKGCGGGGGGGGGGKKLSTVR